MGVCWRSQLFSIPESKFGVLFTRKIKLRAKLMTANRQHCAHVSVHYAIVETGGVLTIYNRKKEKILNASRRLLRFTENQQKMEIALNERLHDNELVCEWWLLQFANMHDYLALYHELIQDASF